MAMSKRDKVALAAVVLLAPGGFLIGGALARHYWKKRQTEKAGSDAAADADPKVSAGDQS